jgi:hypothetical protein
LLRSAEIASISKCNRLVASASRFEDVCPLRRREIGRSRCGLVGGYQIDDNRHGQHVFRNLCPNRHVSDEQVGDLGHA